MSLHNQEVGRMGEDAACEYLLGMGHVILARNWRGGHTELDIVSFSGIAIHFVEVKTSVISGEIQPNNVLFNVRPQDRVTFAKQKNLVAAANMFLHSDYFRQSEVNRLSTDFEIYFDVVSVIISGNEKCLEYIPQAFIPMYF